MQTIKNAEALHRAIAEGKQGFRVCLRFGLYSRKTITLCADGRFKIVNHIDESVKTLTAEQLYTHSNIGEAMSMGAFVAEGPDDY